MKNQRWNGLAGLGLIIMLAIIGPKRLGAQTTVYVVDADIAQNGCDTVSPSEILGSYTESGTNNDRTAYAGPSAPCPLK